MGHHSSANRYFLAIWVIVLVRRALFERNTRQFEFTHLDFKHRAVSRSKADDHSSLVTYRAVFTISFEGCGAVKDTKN